MTAPQDLFGPITRKQFAQYVRDENGEPLDSVIQQLEDQQVSLTSDLPAQVLEAQTVAEAAATQAALANGTLQAAPFVLASPDAQLATARSLAAGIGITLVDGGAGGLLTIKSDQLSAILGADVTDITGAFVNATGLAVTLQPGFTYLVEGMFAFQSAALTTGIGLGFTLPAGASIVGGYWHPSAANALQSAYNNGPASVNANTTAAAAAAANLPIFGRWIVAGAAVAGSMQLQFRTSVPASAVTLKLGLSALIARRIG